jgi:photosystem II stability/assembly factor-like uncharacterized protein
MARGKKRAQARRKAASTARGTKPPPATRPQPEERPALSRRALLAAVLVLVLTGVGAYLAFGSGSDTEQETASGGEDLRVPWLDPDGVTPIIGALDVNPADDSLWLSSNTGMFRLEPGAERPERVTGQLTTDVGSGEISQELVIRFTGPDRLIGSGHPPPDSDLPPALGVIESEDGGRTWTAVSGVGEIDFHAIQTARGRLVASLFGQAAVNVSRDGGRTFEQRTPPAPVVDLEVDPRNPERWIASSSEGLIASTDEGRTWRQLEPIPNVRFSWPESDTLYRVDPGGAIKFSSDGGRSWEDRGSTGGEPHALFADTAEHLNAALLDGTIKESRDGGRSWTDRVVPPS